MPQLVLTGVYGLEDVGGAPAVLKARLACLNDPSDARLAVQPISQNLNILRGYVQNDLGHGQIVVRLTSAARLRHAGATAPSVQRHVKRLRF